MYAWQSVDEQREEKLKAGFYSDEELTLYSSIPAMLRPGYMSFIWLPDKIVRLM